MASTSGSAAVRTEEIASIPLFAGLARAEQERVASASRPLRLSVGQVVVNEGEFAFDFYALTVGGADVVRGRRADRDPGAGRRLRRDGRRATGRGWPLAAAPVPPASWSRPQARRSRSKEAPSGACRRRFLRSAAPSRRPRRSARASRDDGRARVRASRRSKCTRGRQARGSRLLGKGAAYPAESAEGHACSAAGMTAHACGGTLRVMRPSRPDLQMLADGDILFPVRSDGGAWRMARVSPDDDAYAAWMRELRTISAVPGRSSGG